MRRSRLVREPLAFRTISATRASLADLLIVDDDLDAAGALSDVMETEGHETRVAYNGREGMAQLELKKPDLILLDVDMPVLNGHRDDERHVHP